MHASELFRRSKIRDEVKTVFDEGYFAMKTISAREHGEFVIKRNASKEKVVMVFNGTTRLHLVPSEAEFLLREKDVCYVPVGEKVTLHEVQGDSLVTVIEARSNFETTPYCVKFDDVKGDLRGEPGYRRMVYSVLGEDKPAGKLIVGFTEGFKGEWTSYPPHKHDDMLEVYLFYGLGDYYGIQMVESENRVEARAVRDWDAVLIRKGYHPNVSIPKCGIKYMWALYPFKERKLRPETDPRYLRGQ